MSLLKKMPGQVQIQEDVVFGEGGGRELKCDVFTPPDDQTDRTGILIIHGGGWRQGTKEQLKGYGIQLARYGFLCVASEYRLSDEAPWPAQVHDCKAALRWMRANSETLGFDKDKIAVSGNSAGAHLSLMVAGTPNVEEFEGTGGNAGIDTSVAASVGIYAPTKLRTQGHLEGAVDLLFGRSDAPIEIQDNASPINWASQDFPPSLLIHGNADAVVPVSESVNMYNALKEAGAKSEIHLYEGAPHAFDSTAEFGRQVTELILLFVDRHVRDPRTFD
jgi:acetyl esterase/lipase